MDSGEHENAAGQRDGAPHRILVVDDEQFLADVVSTALRYAGFATSAVGTSREARSVIERERPALTILDVALPDGSGIELCQALRRSGYDAPVIFLTARHGTQDKLAGLAIGDDYLTKPFSLDELVARVRAVLRRAGQATQSQHDPMTFADLEIDEDAHVVRRQGHLIELSPTEFKLLRFLTLNAGRVLSKRQILDHVWEYDFGGNHNVVATYISYLRRKIDQYEPQLIHTVPRVGYTLRLPPV
jgi:two-component system, OmpR family, response regulator